jgi:hypothetical protein
MKRRNLFIVLAVFVVIISASKLNAVEGEVPAQQDELSSESTDLQNPNAIEVEVSLQQDDLSSGNINLQNPNVAEGEFLSDNAGNTDGEILNIAETEMPENKDLQPARNISPELREFLDRMNQTGEIEYISRTGRNASLNIKNLDDLKISKDWAVGKSRFSLKDTDVVYVKKIGGYLITVIVNDKETQLIAIEGPNLDIVGGENFLGGKENSFINNTYMCYINQSFLTWLKFINEYGSNGYETLNKDIVVELSPKSAFFRACNEKVFNVMMFGKKLDSYALDYLKNNYLEVNGENGMRAYVYKGGRKGILTPSQFYFTNYDYAIIVEYEMLLDISSERWSNDDRRNEYKNIVMGYVRDNSIRIAVDPKDLSRFIIDTKLYSIGLTYGGSVYIERSLSLQKAEAAKRSGAVKKSAGSPTVKTGAAKKPASGGTVAKKSVAKNVTPVKKK